MGFPDTIDGVWTYIYFSHNRNLKRSVAHQKIGDQGVQRVQFDDSIPPIQFISFNVGGKQFQYNSF